MPGVVLVTWARLDFDSDLLNLEHGPFLAKSGQNRTKSNRIFPKKLAQDRALILQYSDSPMA